jgi:2-polyprenyl-6-methoxyphenol hydroxylase-like FAD-dependent oxidoreductase
MVMQRVGDRALVLGAGMAGLLAARVLADAYGEVVVVDRDQLPEDDEPRRGVPQGAHVHALLARGQQALEELFPGLAAGLALQGAPLGDMVADSRWYLDGHQLARSPSGLVLLSASRPLLEGHVRARVRATPGVVLAPGRDVVAPLTTADRRRVTGVHVARRDGGAQETIAADLVVDATGRGARLPAWLRSTGVGAPVEERLRIDLRYATRTFRAPPDAAGGALAVVCAPGPAHPRGGVVQALEEGRWMLTAAGSAGAHPPADPAGFDAFVRTVPALHEVVRDAEPLDEPVPFRFPAGVRRRYERVRHLPDGLLVVGDAVCSFNPVYGQGMTVAALEALALRRHLLHGGPPPVRRWMREVARLVDAPWNMAVGADLALPAVEGRRSAGTRVMNAYMARLHAAAAEDTELAVAFARVAGLVDPPGRLLRPATVLRVLGSGRARRDGVRDGSWGSIGGTGREERAARGSAA